MSSIFEPEAIEKARLSYVAYQPKHPELPAWESLSLYDRGMYGAMLSQKTYLNQLAPLVMYVLARIESPTVVKRLLRADQALIDELMENMK